MAQRQKGQVATRGSGSRGDRHPLSGHRISGKVDVAVLSHQRGDAEGTGMFFCSPRGKP